ncbi:MULTISPECIES: ABC transporter permease [Pseudomonas]|uniref:ABC transporter permease n=2 Tax=Pseudomonas TaxID=286 RepID=A0ABY5EQP3_9PSED|nr:MULTISPECIES: ABC transporter permease [Pseudomonas]KAF2391923.1 putative aliphatic sulfonates transport permease protein SsuC [Pseudomonas frederiksbergensis]KPN90269.1 ABC transporter permease [Pseudomonas nunensis]MCL5227859.1 ABC transporter permease [Pseudomonas nunensis]UTO16510.1 ABC transporter permease [Pseudomonas nunensis]UZE09439.1 ABC transporter permease [Pseudomonas sp. B21-053]
MTEKTFDTPSASSSFSVNKAIDSPRASRLIPNWLSNWRTPEVFLRLLSPIALLLLWELASQFGLIPQRVIAAPSQIGGTLWAMIVSGELGKHLLVSLQRALLGLSIGVSVGVVAALITGLSKRGEVILDSPMQMLRTIPSLALVPLFILWFGIGEFTKIALIVTGTTFPVYLNLFSGIRNIDPKLIEAANTLGLNRRELIWHVILPGSLPSFFVGLRYSLGISWLALVFVEQINTTAGIGFLASDARDFMRTDVIVICLLIYSVLGLLIDGLIRTLERFALAWRPSFVRN